MLCALPNRDKSGTSDSTCADRGGALELPPRPCSLLVASWYEGGGGVGVIGFFDGCAGSTGTYLTMVVGGPPHPVQNGSSVKKSHGERKIHRMKNMPKTVIHVASHSSADGVVVCGEGVVSFELMRPCYNVYTSCKGYPARC